MRSGAWRRVVVVAGVAWGAAAASLHAQAAESAPPPAQAPVVTPDSVRPFLVFAPAGESWFVAASRGKRMLLDIGRVDREVRKDSAVAAAYRAAVTAATPVKVGTPFTLRAPWGTETVRATAVDTWNGRIVLVLEGSAAMDSAAQRGTVAATAFRAPDPRTPVASPPAILPGPVEDVAPTCARGPVRGPEADRVRAVRDSIAQALRALGPPIYERLARRVTVASSQVSGCFGAARVMLAVSLRANGAEWTRERVVLVDTLGAVVPLAVEDLRFKVHDLLHAVDGDGDGVDDVAAVGRTFRAGGTTILRYDAVKRRLVRIVAGFIWEDL